MIITVINQKGGTGKTTTAAALLSYYTAQGAHALGTVVFDTAIRETVTIKQAQAMQEGIYQSDPNATTAGAADYLAFIKELEQATAPGNNRR